MKWRKSTAGRWPNAGVCIEAARRLGIPRQMLQYKLRSLWLARFGRFCIAWAAACSAVPRDWLSRCSRLAVCSAAPRGPQRCQSTGYLAISGQLRPLAAWLPDEGVAPLSSGDKVDWLVSKAPSRYTFRLKYGSSMIDLDRASVALNNCACHRSPAQRSISKPTTACSSYIFCVAVRVASRKD